MLDARGRVLYVGKAADLKKRVSAYFGAGARRGKTRALMERMRRVEVTVTASETEALLLEQNLIKTHHPRYNVLLRDDKSYPYIRITADEPYPRVTFYRGSRRRPGRFFGPYPSAAAVRDTLNTLYRAFQLRQCADSVFKNRARPCLQYQIKRCSAPCVGLIDAARYAADVSLAAEFLSGRATRVIEELVRRMDAASRELRFEEAIRQRDRIKALRRVLERQSADVGRGDIDVLAARVAGGLACVQVLQIRGGLQLGDQAYYPQLPDDDIGEAALLAAFIGQYYLQRKAPRELVVARRPEDADTLAKMLSLQSGRKTRIHTPTRGRKRQWLDNAAANAAVALEARLASRAGMRARLAALQSVLALPQTPMRLECFDVSHTHGDATVASCVVFGPDGPLKQAYRRFNIKEVAGGDDYAALRQAVARRYRRALAGEHPAPQALFIDGGKGQLSAACAALAEVGASGIAVVGVAKGRTRKPGLETLWLMDGGRPRELQVGATALSLIQQIRDEAHRFAIIGHRRQRARLRSPLEEVPGLGPRRRQLLLKHFGGLQGVRRAEIDDLRAVKGVGRKTAEVIYDMLRAPAAASG